jgi:hypothetical protein
VNWARRSGSPFPGGSLAEWRRTVGRLRGSWRQLLGGPLRAMRHPYPRGQMGPLRGRRAMICGGARGSVGRRATGRRGRGRRAWAPSPY